jgi:hypothetical protein
MKTLIVIILLLQIIFPGWSSAAMIALTTQELTDSAEVVVVGTVVQTKAQWDADKSTILTRTFVRINETIKGKAEGILELEHIGGEIGEIGLRTSNQPFFFPDENVILFLRNAKNSTKSKRLFELVGMNQGKFTLHNSNKDKVEGGGKISGIIDGVAAEVDANEFLDNIREMSDD